MSSRVVATSTKRLLKAASVEPDRLRRHLLVGAALRELLPNEPVVVGGTAEEYWAPADYQETDLEMCVALSPKARSDLKKGGFEPLGRHWMRDDIAVAVEFPESNIDGEWARTVLERVDGGAARIIGVEDLYLDRVRQATVQENNEGIEFKSALAVAAAQFEQIDWGYVEGRILAEERSQKLVGESMRRIDSKVRGRVRLTAEIDDG